MPPSVHSFVLVYSVAALCVLFIGIDKSGLGSGLGVLATPLMSLLLTSSDAIGVILPLLCVCDLFALRHYWSTFDRRNLVLMIPGSIAGIVAASAILFLLRTNHAALDRFLRLLIGLTSVIFVAWQWMPKTFFTRQSHFRPGAAAATLAGAASGFTSALAHAGGPPATMFLLPQRLDFRVFIGTTVWFFAATNFMKLIPYALLGLLRRDCLVFSLKLMSWAPVGILLGVWLARHINQKVFRNVVLTVLLLTGLQFISGYNIADLVRAMR